jgi:GNAT superfamily N-acetyltransferase
VNFAMTTISRIPAPVIQDHPDESWAVTEGDQTLARCSLWWAAAPRLAGHRLGTIGHYFAADAAAAHRVLDDACRRLAEHGCTLAIGPMDGNTWRRYRFVTDRGPEPPFLLEPDNPDDWPGHFTGHCFTPLAEYFSAINDDLTRTDPQMTDVARRAADQGIVIRPIELDRFDAELRLIHALSLASFTRNFLYTAIGEEEFVAQYRGVRPHVRPELVPMAERAGELIGFLFMVPDLLQTQREQAVDTVIFKTMAVHPDHRSHGLGRLLMSLGHQTAHRLGYRRAIHALMHADNHSRRISDHTARTIRRYTLYARPLGGTP